MEVRVLLFGAPRVEMGGEATPLPRARGRALLAYLAYTRQSHTREALAALLWPNYAPGDAHNNLRRELSLLRSALGAELIDSDRGHAGLDRHALGGGRLWIDCHAFDSHITAAENHRHGSHLAGDLCAECAAHLTAAEALYTADFLAGFGLPDAPAFDEWQSFAGQRLRADVDSARARLAAWHLARGEYDRALELAQRRLAADPLNEPAHRDQLRALTLAGRPAAARREHETFARRLAEELGQAPEPETTAAAVAQAVSLQPRQANSLRYRELPAQATPFLGREAELAILSDLFADPAIRLVTLVGPGGMGKTRLALAWAREQNPSPNLSQGERDRTPSPGLSQGEREQTPSPDLSQGERDRTPSPNLSQGERDRTPSPGLSQGERGPRFVDGVVFVDLAPVAGVEGLLPAVADALRYPLQSGQADPRSPQRQIAGFLAAKRLLLLLDNIEHLLDATPELLALLAAAPGLALLVTSRERLNVRPETVLPIDGLALAAAGDDADPLTYPAGRLFVGAARRSRPEFSAGTPAERQTVARICRLVGGMPLAIEMAAAWADTLSLEEIAAELSRGLDLLETDMRDVPARQRSVRAAIESTWQRLDESDRRVFAQLSVFRGGLGRDAVAAVAGATPRQMATLAHKALVRPVAGGHYRLHELLRQYAAEKLAADPELADAAGRRHAHAFAELLAEATPRLVSADEAGVLLRLAADSDNIDVAIRRLLASRDAAPLLRAFNGLCLYYDAHLRARDAHQVCQQITAAFDPPAGDDSRLLLARATNWRVYFHLKLTDERDSVPPALAQARALLAQLDGRGLPLADDLALNHYLAGDPGLDMDYTDTRVASFEAAYRLFAQTGNTWGTAQALHRLFMGYTYGGHTDPAASRALAQEALTFAAALPNGPLHADLVSELLQYAAAFDERDLIAPFAAEMERDLSAPADGMPGEAQSRGRYAWPLLLLGRVDDALACYRHSLDARLAYGLPYMMRDAHFYGRLLLHAGHYDEAATQFERGRLMAGTYGSNFIAWLVRVLDAMRLLATGDAAAAERVLRQALTLDLSLLAVGDRAGQWANLGLAVARQGRPDEARPLLARALRGAIEVYNYLPLIEALPTIGLVLAQGDAAQQERAAELYGLAMAQPYYAQAQVLQDASGRPLAAALRALPPDVAAAAQARGRALPLWPAAKALLAEIAPWEE